MLLMLALMYCIYALKRMRVTRDENAVNRNILTIAKELQLGLEEGSLFKLELTATDKGK